MGVSKLPNGRFRAKLKSGRVDVASKVFDTKREATDWLARESAALAGGVDPRASRQRVRVLLKPWLETRKGIVSRNTYLIDASLERVMPTNLLALQVGNVSEREIARVFERWITVNGYSEGTASRYRTSMSAFFAWCVREKIISSNPVQHVKVPKQSVEKTEMLPYTEDELEAAYLRWKAHDEHLANILLILGWTGLRWSEARAIEVRDLMRVPTPGLMVRRAAPEGVGTKATKGRSSRRVPLANRILPIVLEMAKDKSDNDLLFVTSRGSRLHRTPVIRAVKWAQTARGRRIHDLRHTAACLWLTKGVDAATVQAWMGHESLATTNIYVHFLGGVAHQAGLARLNAKPDRRPKKNRRQA